LQHDRCAGAAADQKPVATATRVFA
jgi:hypothetical protein